MTRDISAMLAAAIQVSPTVTVSSAFVDMVNRMDTDGQSSSQIVLAIADGMCDGLRHGNWPVRT